MPSWDYGIMVWFLNITTNKQLLSLYQTSEKDVFHYVVH